MPNKTESDRIFYCPAHGRQTEADVKRQRKKPPCRYCQQWLTRSAPKSAKRFGES